MRQRRLLLGAVAILMSASFATGAYFFSRLTEDETGSPQRETAAIEKLFAASFANPEGGKATLSHLRGKPLIINFWATWCPPCLKEIPLFSRLQEKYPDIQFVGIAADTPDNVRNFAASHKFSYPILVATDGIVSLMSELGNSRNGLPFTISIDTRGRPRHSKLGALSEPETERIIAELSGN